jgi:membrane-associated phospholipid phosphatase
MARCFLFLALIFSVPLFSQKKDDHQKVYRVRLAYELPASVACIGLSSIGFKQLGKVATLSESQVAGLNPYDINSFDRPIAFLDPAGFENAQKKSDLFLNVAIFSPALLVIDKKIRKDWLDLLTMYVVTHAVDNAIYFAANFSVRRARPFTYNPEVPMESKTGEGKSNSFFSGHTAFSAASTFFAAKVFTDYNHIKGWKRIMWYGIASVPPAVVGYYRTRAGKHFKTDVIAGFISGAASGILVPELHRIKKKNDNLSFAPFFSGDASGITVSLKF